MKVESKINCHEVNGVEYKVSDTKQLNVRNVWNLKNMVELQLESGDRFVVSKNDLLKAIENATNNEF